MFRGVEGRDVRSATAVCLFQSIFVCARARMLYDLCARASSNANQSDTPRVARRRDACDGWCGGGGGRDDPAATERAAATQAQYIHGALKAGYSGACAPNDAAHTNGRMVEEKVRSNHQPL